MSCPPPSAPSDASPALLAELDAALGRATASADQEFLAIGEALGRAVQVFGRLSSDLAELAGNLHGEDAGAVTASLEQVMRSTSHLVESEHRTLPLLEELESFAADAASRIGALRRIVAEIGALAINGKIQAAVVSASGIDFSVFTTEIGRLGGLAESAIERAASRLDSVASAIAEARRAATEFERNQAAELEAVRIRITDSLATLAERRRMAADAADAVAGRSRQIYTRIAGAVAELQINDSVGQRIEHVRTALRTAADLAGGRPALASAICRLQAAQLRGGADDYRHEVEHLIGNLSGLAAEAAAIGQDAEAAFSGDDGGLFVAAMTQDIGRAGELLSAYAEAHQLALDVITSVSQSFRAMEEDLGMIRSVDADMRIMGLNATLKCGRLGDDGRALGVVAHELRACSRRTEDCTQAIAEVLSRVIAVATSLDTSSEDERKADRDLPLGILGESAATLSALGDCLSSALSELRSNSDSVSQSLSATAGKIDIHLRMDDAAGEVIARLASLEEGQPEPDVRDDLVRLMQPLYTMERERAIHRTFHGGDIAGLMEDPPAAAPQADDIDDMFF